MKVGMAVGFSVSQTYTKLHCIMFNYYGLLYAILFFPGRCLMETILLKFKWSLKRMIGWKEDNCFQTFKTWFYMSRFIKWQQQYILCVARWCCFWYPSEIHWAMLGGITSAALSPISPNTEPAHSHLTSFHIDTCSGLTNHIITNFKQC